MPLAHVKRRTFSIVKPPMPRNLASRGPLSGSDPQNRTLVILSRSHLRACGFVTIGLTSLKWLLTMAAGSAPPLRFSVLDRWGQLVEIIADRWFNQVIR